MTGSDKKDKMAASDAYVSFWIVTMKGVEDIMKAAPSAWSKSTVHLYKHEKEVFAKHTNFVYQGAFISVLLFATLRVAGSKWAREMLAKARFHGKEKVPKSANKNSEKEEWKSYLEIKSEERLKEVTRTSTVPEELALSLTFGVSSSMFLIRPNEFRKDVQLSLLYPGKSLAHQYMCPRYKDAFLELKQGYPELETSENDTIREFVSMIEHCDTRSRYIEQQKRRKVADPDNVPFPGLRL